MKTRFYSLLSMLIISTLLFSAFVLSPVHASGLPGGEFVPPSIKDDTGPQQSPQSDKVVLGGSYVLEQGQSLDGNLFVLGGVAQLKSDSAVKGDVLILGGTLIAQGEISGDISVLGGLVTVESGAHIKGEVNLLSATLQQEEGSLIDGKTNEITSETWPSIIPERLHVPGWQGAPSVIIPGEAPTGAYPAPARTGWDLLWLVIQSLAWAALAVLITLFGPKIVSTASDTAVEKPFISLGVGCLTVFVGTAVLLLLVITICGIPISLIGGFLLLLAWGFGVISIGAETGIRFARLFKADWALPVSAGVGTFLLTLVSNSVELLIPCLGWLLPAGVGLVGLGAAALTRFGTRPYPAASDLYTPVHIDTAEQIGSMIDPIQSRSEVDENQKDNDIEDA